MKFQFQQYIILNRNYILFPEKFEFKRRNFFLRSISVYYPNVHGNNSKYYIKLFYVRNMILT